MLSPRAEELLSYLIGLGPVGTPVRLRFIEIEKDIRQRKSHVHMLLKQLEQHGAVAKFSTGHYRVTNRTILDAPRPEKPVRTPRVIERKHRRDERGRDPIWPPSFDRRDFTAIIFGDPLPERSALARRA